MARKQVAELDLDQAARITQYLDALCDILQAKSKVCELAAGIGSKDIMIEQLLDSVTLFQEHINYIEEVSNQLKEACGHPQKQYIHLVGYA